VLEGFWVTETVAARLSHAPPPLAACGFMRRRKKFQEQVGLAQLLLLFPSLPAVMATVTCERRTHTTQ
jgi:hypothetical protein